MKIVYLTAGLTLNNLGVLAFIVNNYLIGFLLQVIGGLVIVSLVFSDK